MPCEWVSAKWLLCLWLEVIDEVSEDRDRRRMDWMYYPPTQSKWALEHVGSKSRCCLGSLLQYGSVGLWKFSPRKLDCLAFCLLCHLSREVDAECYHPPHQLSANFHHIHSEMLVCCIEVLQTHCLVAIKLILVLVQGLEQLFPAHWAEHYIAAFIKIFTMTFMKGVISKCVRGHLKYPESQIIELNEWFNYCVTQAITVHLKL